MDEAESLGLKFRPGIRSQLAPDPQGILHDSCVGIFAHLKTLPRAVPLVSTFGSAANAFHPSVIARNENPPIEQSPYWDTKILAKGESTAVDIFAHEHWNYTGAYLKAGAEYTLAATGQWVDGSIKYDPSGKKNEHPHISDLKKAASKILQEIENEYRVLSGDDHAKFVGVKRAETENWFALIGVIANRLGTDGAGNPVEHETFLIGEKLERFSPKKSGYLYCFANDAWEMYGNNRGSVRLTVLRTN